MVSPTTQAYHRGRAHLLRKAFASFVAALAITSSVALAQSPQPQPTFQQMKRTVGAGVQRSLGTLPQVTRQEAGMHPQPPPPRVPDPLTLAARQGQAARVHGPLPQGAVAMPPVVPQLAPFTLQQNLKLTPTAGINIISTDEAAACAGVTPADQALAVGDSSGTAAGVLQVINDCVVIYDKSGNLQVGYPKSLTNFFGLSPSTPTTDPRALYDWINHRYVFVMIQFDPSQNSASSYWIAVSSGDNPTGGYCLYNLPVQSVAPAGPGHFPLPDFPRLGQDRQAFYLASNVFDTPTTYKWEEILVLPKAQMYTCSGISFTTFFNLQFGGILTDTTQPANIFSPGDDPRSEYLVTAKNFFFADPKNGLIVWTIFSPLSSPTLTGVGVPTGNNYSTPPAASQPGASNSIDASDNRVSGMAFYMSGSIYASLATNGGSGQPACILYQIQPFIASATGSIASARILNEIILGGGSNSWYYCTQQPDPEGNVTTVFNFSGSSNFASLAYVSRRAGQPTGLLPDGGIFLQNGAGPIYTQGRWGDYTATAPAGLVAGGGTGGVPVMWFAGMYAKGNLWGTAIGKNGYIAITQP
jgi:hypothetical protein